MDKTEKTADEIRLEAEQSIKNLATETTKAEFEKRMNAITSKYDEQLEKGATKEDLEKANKSMTSEIDKLSSEIKKMGQMDTSRKVDTTNPKATLGVLKNALKNQAVEKLQQFRDGNPSAGAYTEKMITPESFGVGGYEELNTDRSLPLDANPYAPIYLRNIFPNVSTSNNFLSIWKRGAVTGKAGVWKRGSGEEGADVKKPSLKIAYAKEVVEINWIPATMRIQREILDDLSFMADEINNALIYSENGILAAENELIVDYIRDNAVDFTKDAEFPIGVEKLLAAAFGQLGDKYMTPTHILMNSWDYLTYIAFNKAGGSGEYDLPGGDTLRFINGRMFINSLEAVRVPELSDNESFVIAAGRSRFVNRQEIRTKVFESSGDDAEYNNILIRSEERVGFFTYDVNSFVKVTLATTTDEPEVP